MNFLKKFQREDHLTLTKAIQYLTLAAIAVGVAMNIKDIGRYVRISTM